MYIALLIDAGPAYLPGGKFLLKSRNPLQMPPALAPFSAPILALKERERERERKKEREKERDIKEQPDEKFRPRRGDRESTLWSATALSVVAEIER